MPARVTVVHPLLQSIRAAWASASTTLEAGEQGFLVKEMGPGFGEVLLLPPHPRTTRAIRVELTRVVRPVARPSDGAFTLTPAEPGRVCRWTPGRGSFETA